MNPLLKPALLCICCLFFLAACGTTQPSRFYLLSALEKPDKPERNSGPGVIVGPVTLPDYLLRPQIVRRNDANEVVFEEFHRWAEPLHGNFSRVLAENLSLLLDSSRVLLYPGYKTGQFPYQILVNVIRMDAGPEQQVELVAHWRVVDRNNKKLLASSKTSVIEPVENDSRMDEYKAVVSAQSRALLRLSREIAQAVNELRE